MEPARFKPRVQLFVCTNARAAGDPLESACGAAGPGAYAALKRAVAAAGRVGDAWITRAACLGHCPPRGCAVALYPSNEHWVNVTEADAGEILARALASVADPESRRGARE
jgi:(2Fe-2S) ferredoxin